MRARYSILKTAVMRGELNVGQQTNKIVKRARRKKYLERLKVRAKTAKRGKK